MVLSGSRKVSARGAGFTLVELLVVVAIIALLVVLLLPAIQSAREAARRAICMSNLRQIGLGAINYEATYGIYPPAALKWPGSTSHPNNFFGYPVRSWSWYLRILPYMDEKSIYDQMVFTPPTFGKEHEHQNNRRMENQSFSWAWCPSSPLKRWEDIDPNVSLGQRRQYQFPDYVGISGSWNTRIPIQGGSSMSDRSISGVMVDDECIAKRSNDACAHRPPWVRVKDVYDGISKTLMFGEHSGWSRRPGEREVDCRNGGAMLRGTLSNWYLQGTSVHSTTIRYPVGLTAANFPGGCGFGSPNIPLISAHRSGAWACFADGHMQYLSVESNIDVVKLLADRADGQDIPEGGLDY